jgi:Pvc16 N-terminal domain
VLMLSANCYLAACKQEETPMIDKAMSFIVGELNSLLSTRFQSNENLAVLSSLANPDGTLPPVIENKIVVSLINVEREPSANGGNWPMRPGAEGFGRVSPPLGLNLLVLVTASFGGNYSEALKVLSTVMAFFQGKPMFNAQNSAAFPVNMEKLSLELVNLSIHEVNNVWSILGAKYMPSIVYKVRMLVVQENWISERVPAVTAPSTQVKS